MARSIFKQLLTLTVTSLLIGGCAKISSPSGGPRDIEPPVILKSTPENGARNFNGKRFAITFDEYVTLENINEKFMISPPLVMKPKVSLKGKIVVVEYEDDLRDSTTYTFNFQDAIKDLNEGNKIDNYQFVFSTGPVIDSLSVTGNIFKASDLNPPEATLAMLYIEHEDSAFAKRLPSYIAMADKNGYFRIDNVSAREYRLYALKDADNSKNFNLADEEIAFLDSTIRVTPEKNWLPVVTDTLMPKLKDTKAADTIVLEGDYRLYLFQHLKKLHYLTSSSRNLAYKLNYTLSLPPDTLGFHFSIPDAGPDSWFIERNRTNDSIQVWITDSALYKQQIITSVINYPFTDSAGITALKEDTIMMRFMTPRAPRGKVKITPYKFTSNVTTGALKPGGQIVFLSQTPFRNPDTSKIRLYEVDGNNRVRIPYTLNRDSIYSYRMTLSGKLAMNKNYIFIADSASFGNIYGEQSDSTGIRFAVKNDEAYGKLVLNITNYEGNRIIQLLSFEGEKVIKEVKMEKDGKVEFPLLDKGAYRVRVIYDLDNDGKWTTGDFSIRRQPEPVSYMPVEVDIKENWVRDYNWDLGEKNVKKLKIKPSQSRAGR